MLRTTSSTVLFFSQDDLAGIGADCPRQSSASPSCLGTGRIDASCCSATVGLGRCSYLAYMSGVLCCQDEPQGKLVCMSNAVFVCCTAALLSDNAPLLLCK